MNLKATLFFITILMVYSCKPQKVESHLSKDFIYPDSNILKNQVVITGTSDDKLALTYLEVFTEINLTSKEYVNIDKEVFEDSLHMVIKDLNKPLFAEITTSGLSPNYYFFRGRVFLIPGDTIQVQIKDQKVTFKGKNAVYNNFYHTLNQNTSAYNKAPYQGSLLKHKETITRIFNERMAYLNKFIKKNTINSKLFVRTINTNLKHEYFYNLINPPNIKADFLEDWYFNESDVLYTLFYKEYSDHPEGVIDLKDYFGKITLDIFKNRDDFDNSVFLRMNLNAYIRDYFLNQKYAPYSKQKFLAEKKFIEDNFDEDIKLFAIKNLIQDYHKKGFGKSEQSVTLLKQVIDEYYKQFSKPWYKNQMDKIKNDLERYDFNLSSFALESKFVNINSDTLSLKNVFKRSNKRIKVIDFWASWCPPCIKQIKNGKDFKDRLSVKYNVEWIFISPEKDYNNWLIANRKYSETLNFYNSFYMIKGRKAALTKFFKINEIPRYIIFNHKNTIVLNNAPSPSDNENFEKIIDRIYSQEKE